MQSHEAGDRLASYEVRGLFNDRDFHFELYDTEPTILTGGNGSGKSTILRTIDSFCTEQWVILDRQPFREVTLRYDSGKMIRAKRSDVGLEITAQGHAAWTYVGERTLAKHLPTDLRHMTSATRRRLLRAIGSASSDLNKLSPAERATLFEWGDTFRHVVSFGPSPPWIHEMVSRVPVLFVTDQRLMLESPDEDAPRTKPEKLTTRAAVDQAVHRVRHLMSEALAEYAATSQRLDRDFPQRVVAAMSKGVRISDARLREILQENERQARALQRVGLLPEDVSTSDFSDFQGADVKPVIATHAEDTAKKLAVLAPLRELLTLFVDFLSQHYETKRLYLDPRLGFEIVTGTDRIRPSDLSSGEQQMLVLAYQILFKAEPGTLILIDEPELSLHVLWQDSFLEDISRMGGVRNLSFLLATHSPTLISGRRDLTRSLDIGR